MKEGAPISQLLLLEWHFCVYWHFLWFSSVPEPSQTAASPLAVLAADSSPQFTVWSCISRQCCALVLWDSHALSPCQRSQPRSSSVPSPAWAASVLLFLITTMSGCS